MPTGDADVSVEKERNRGNVNANLDKDLYKKTQTLATLLDRNANEMIERGMELVLKEYEDILKESELLKELNISLTVN